MVNIVFVQSSSIIFHSRAVKILKSLKKDYSICGIGWNREGLEKKFVDDFFTDLDLFNMKAPFSNKSLVAYFPLFWIWIFVKLIQYNPKIIHAVNLDTVIPCYLYKIIFRKKLVFDVIDRISMSRISPKNVILYSLVNQLEEFYSKHSDILITVTPKLLKTFKRKPSCYDLILNCSENYKNNKIKKQNGMLTLCCAAPVTRQQGLGKITSAIHDLERVELVFAGRVLDKEFLDYILKNPNVKYVGLLEPKDAIALQANSDVIISLYDLKIPNYHFAYSVKTFDAMMLGKPVITNISPELLEEVRCGIEIDIEDENKLKSAIIRLRDDIEYRESLGKNGRKAFEQKYNWSEMEKKLKKIYESLFKK